MKMRPFAFLALLSLAGCGVPGGYDLCKSGCDHMRSCGYSSEGQSVDCKNNCEANKGKSSDDDNRLATNCKNAADIRTAEASCYASTACGGNVVSYSLALASCLANTPACVKP